MPPALMTVKTCQAAVGQGGLMVQEISVDAGGSERGLVVAFDCGSNNRDALYEAIESIEPQAIDVLLISHLDSDHVNGIDFLLAKRTVETVVLPCLDELYTVVVVCRALAGAGVTGDFKSFVEDPVKWFAARGVKRVVFISRDEDTGEGPPAPSPNDAGPANGYFVESSQSGLPRIGYSIVSRHGAEQTVEQVRMGKLVVDVITAAPVVDLRLALHVAASDRNLQWMLMPYVHPFDRGLIQVFLRAVKQKISKSRGLSSKGFRQRLLESLGKRETRKELKACYGILASDHNEVSLSLYSGPIPGNTTRWSSYHDVWELDWRVEPDAIEARSPAWLCTGDANLKLGCTKAPWMARHATLFEMVSVFILPHHGSAESLSTDLLDRLGPVAYVACAAKGSKSHPHRDVRAALRQRGFGLIQVSEKAKSRFGTMASVRG